MLSYGGNKMIQTDLYSFSYKKGSVSPFCKRCGAGLYKMDGKTKDGKQIRKCRRCGFRFVWTSDLPRRNFFSNVISFAAEVYSTVGISLRRLSEMLKKYFNIKISYEGIRKWILAAKNFLFTDDNIIPTKTWHADETYIKMTYSQNKSD
jgi:hypothetical protein